MKRRDFVFGAAAAPAFAADIPVHKAIVKPLFKSPDKHPNGLETVREGFWIGEQTSDRAHLVTISGKLIRSVNTESSNTSGIAFGGGHLWMAANGKAIGRPAKPTDSYTGAIIKVDPANGKTVARYPVPGGGGVHGLEFAEGTLWITSLKLQKLSQVNPKTFELIHQIPVKLGRAHGLAWDNDAIWCMHSTEREIHKLNPDDGTLLEKILIGKDDPDPHGMSMYRGHLYYCDAGISPDGKDNESRWAGWVCRIDF